MSIPSWARVGAKVVCIKRTPWTPWTRLAGRDVGISLPVFGDVCLIEETGVDEYGGWIGIEGNPRDRFNVYQFRPVKTSDDDISEHFAILLRTPSKVDA